MNFNAIKLFCSLRRLWLGAGCGWFLISTVLAPSADATVTNIVSFTNTNPITINGFYTPATPYPSDLVVYGIPTNLYKVTVSIFGLTDPSTGGNGSPGGLDILLSQGGDTNPAVNLMFNAGILGNDVSNVNLTIDDHATDKFTSSTAVTNGTYQASAFDNGVNPPQTITNLAGFIGTTLNTNWDLYIYYEDYYGPGIISNGWCLNFYYLINAPSVTTLAATQVSNSSTTLNATVTPGGGATSVYFEWGPTTSYGNFTITNLLSANFVSPQSVSTGLSGLVSDTAYHFQAVAVNAAGTNFGGDKTVTTSFGQSALSILPGTGLPPVLALTGDVGSIYAVQFATNLAPPITWITFTNVALTNATESVYPGVTSAKAEFFRALKTTFGRPLLNIVPGTSLPPVLKLSGDVGSTYAVQSATNLVSPITWNTFTNITLTNFTESVYPSIGSTKAEFFRAIKQ